MAFGYRLEGFDPTIVQLQGELDIATAPSVSECLARICGDVSIDCSGLDFVDASGLRVFVSGHERCQSKSAKFVLLSPSPMLMELLRITELDQVLETRQGENAHGIP